jgi:hypothetical protein
MGNNFINRNYAEKIEILTSRAKDGSTHTADLDIGESCYLLSLIGAVKLFRMKCMSSDELYHEQKRLEAELLKYYQHRELFDLHISIRNRYSPVLTEAEKSGCNVCQRLVRIFDGRN